MNKQHTSSDIAQVEGWVDNLAVREQATERITAILAGLIGDIDHSVRRKAYRELQQYLAMRQGKVSLGLMPLAAWWRRPGRCIQLLILFCWVAR